MDRAVRHPRSPLRRRWSGLPGNASFGSPVFWTFLRMPSRGGFDLARNHPHDVAIPIRLGEGAREHHLSPFQQDRKSTRLNSSHLVISYAVFCLKKKKIRQDIVSLRQKNNTEHRNYD